MLISRLLFFLFTLACSGITSYHTGLSTSIYGALVEEILTLYSITVEYYPNNQFFSVLKTSHFLLEAVPPPTCKLHFDLSLPIKPSIASREIGVN